MARIFVPRCCVCIQMHPKQQQGTRSHARMAANAQAHIKLLGMAANAQAHACIKLLNTRIKLLNTHMHLHNLPLTLTPTPTRT